MALSGHSSNEAQSADETDDFTVVHRAIEIANNMPLDHRLPSPEEQCQIIALKLVYIASHKPTKIRLNCVTHFQISC